MYRLAVSNLAKRFGARRVFSAISFELMTGESIAITGPNGSGKTTLLMTLLACLRPTAGEITYSQSETRLDEDHIRSCSSLVAPYLNLYDNLTAEENLKFFATVAGASVTGKEIDALLDRVGLKGRGMDLVREYSSGMTQRLKYAIALLNEPAFLFLDEPTANLDDDGKQVVADIIEQYRKKSILVIATNEREEYGFASKLCRVGD